MDEIQGGCGRYEEMKYERHADIKVPKERDLLSLLIPLRLSQLELRECYTSFLL